MSSALVWARSPAGAGRRSQVREPPLHGAVARSAHAWLLWWPGVRAAKLRLPAYHVRAHGCMLRRDEAPLGRCAPMADPPSLPRALPDEIACASATTRRRALGEHTRQVAITTHNAEVAGINRGVQQYL